MLTTTHNLKGFEELVKDWNYCHSVDIYTDYLPNILKADIGGVLDHELPNKERIGCVLASIVSAFEMFKKMAGYLDCPEVKANKAYKHLLTDIKELFENDIENDVFTSLFVWIDEGLKVHSVPSREYALKQTTHFEAFFAILKDCFDLAEQVADNEREVTNA